MNSIFWVATVVMAVVAFGFVAKPLFANKNRVLLLGGGAVLLAVSTIMYVKLGSPPFMDKPSAHQSDGSGAKRMGVTSSTDVGSVASMVEGLASRLAQDPSDGGSWLLLARSYKHLNRIEDALSAYEKASALGYTDSEFDSLSTSDSTATSPGAQVYGSVSLSAAATQLIQATDTVFVFAKAVDGPGIPAAVLRRPASDLPIDFLLNDSQSMVDGVKLSDFDEVVVTARITRRGDATNTLKGLEAKSDRIAVSSNQHITLIIE